MNICFYPDTGIKPGDDDATRIEKVIISITNGSDGELVYAGDLAKCPELRGVQRLGALLSALKAEGRVFESEDCWTVDRDAAFKNEMGPRFHRVRWRGVETEYYIGDDEAL